MKRVEELSMPAENVKSCVCHNSDLLKVIIKSKRDTNNSQFGEITKLYLTDWHSEHFYSVHSFRARYFRMPM